MLTVDIGDTCANTCVFDKTGKYLAVGCSNGEVKMLNVQNGGEVVASIRAYDKAAVSAVLINQENN
jgi:WD40 repeat protein